MTNEEAYLLTVYWTKTRFNTNGKQKWNIQWNKDVDSIHHEKKIVICISRIIGFSSKADTLESSGQCYKTFYGRNYATSGVFLYDLD
jgi:hypothetical protein